MKEQDLDDLRELIEFLKEHNVAEFDLERDGMKIRLKFGQGTGAPLTSVVTPAATAAAPPSPAAPEAQENLHIVKSPIVGTFFGSPAPGAPPFVAVGDRIDSGQVLCIVEAMKLMNEIEADAAGEIARILVADGQPIEFGQPLFAIRKA